MCVYTYTYICWLKNNKTSVWCEGDLREKNSVKNDTTLLPLYLNKGCYLSDKM